MTEVLLEYKAADGGRGFMFFCPGCNEHHSFIVARSSPGPLWTWNGDMEKPSFSPSLGVGMSMPEHRCHSFVRDGQIQYLDDCYHELAGKTVDMVAEA